METIFSQKLSRYILVHHKRNMLWLMQLATGFTPQYTSFNKVLCRIYCEQSVSDGGFLQVCSLLL
jgi:hypothetical protein